MTVSLQVLYPTAGGSRFDHDYYVNTHLPLVAQHMGAHLQDTVVTRCQPQAAGTDPAFHVTATLLFADKAAFEAGMGAAGPVLEDIPKFFDAQPQMLVGEVVG